VGPCENRVILVAGCSQPEAKTLWSELVEGQFVPQLPTSHARNNFDAIRLAMALLVVWSHSFAIYVGSEDREPISILMNGTYNAGNIGVLVFFIISGFLICRSFDQRRAIAEYFERRVRRIYPGYMVATSICAFVVIPIFSSRTDLSATVILKTVGLNLLLRNYFPPSDVFNGAGVNGSLWSIPFEFWCYIGLAMLGLSRLLKARWSIVAIACLAMFVRVWFDLSGRKPGGGLVEFVIGWPYAWVVVLPCFLAGVVLYLYRDVVPRSGLAALAGLLLLVCTARLPIDPLCRSSLVHLLFVPVVAYGVICLAFSPRVKLHNAARFGDFSYGTYLYAYPIQQMLSFFFGHELKFQTYILAAMLLALLAGAVSWYSVERWFLVRNPKQRSPALGAAGFDLATPVVRASGEPQRSE
jgi:peptidoglycan/LPS O-acetylase OafA/YrhL